MRSRLLVILSLVLLALSSLFWAVSFNEHALHPSFLSFGETHLGAINGRLLLFHRGTWPYSGGGLMHGPGGVEVWATTSSGHFAGIYYVQFDRPAPFGTYWTLNLPLYYFLLLFLLIPLIRLGRYGYEKLRTPPRGFPIEASRTPVHPSPS